MTGSKETETRKSIEAVIEDLGGNAAVARINRAFDCMEIAEEILAKLFKTKSREPKKAFLLCQPPTWAYSAGERLYRAHITEQLIRLKDSKDLREPTTAEAVFIASEASLRAPLSLGFTLAYIRLGERIGIKPPAAPGDREDPAHNSPTVEHEIKDAISALYDAARKLDRGTVGELEEEIAADS